MAPYGGVYDSHIRDEGETGRHLAAIEEVATSARASGARGEFVGRGYGRAIRRGE